MDKHRWPVLELVYSYIDVESVLAPVECRTLKFPETGQDRR